MEAGIAPDAAGVDDQAAIWMRRLAASTLEAAGIGELEWIESARGGRIAGRVSAWKLAGSTGPLPGPLAALAVALGRIEARVDARIDAEAIAGDIERAAVDAGLLEREGHFRRYRGTDAWDGVAPGAEWPEVRSSLSLRLACANARIAALEAAIEGCREEVENAVAEAYGGTAPTGGAALPYASASSGNERARGDRMPRGGGRHER